MQNLFCVKGSQLCSGVSRPQQSAPLLWELRRGPCRQGASCPFRVGSCSCSPGALTCFQDSGQRPFRLEADWGQAYSDPDVKGIVREAKLGIVLGGSQCGHTEGLSLSGLSLPLCETGYSPLPGQASARPSG